MRRDYGSTRSIFTALEVCGWALAALGIGLALWAALAGAAGPYSPNGMTEAASIALMGWGADGVISGLVILALARIGGAVVDMAEATRRMAENSGGTGKAIKAGPFFADGAIPRG